MRIGTAICKYRDLWYCIGKYALNESFLTYLHYWHAWGDDFLKMSVRSHSFCFPPHDLRKRLFLLQSPFCSPVPVFLFYVLYERIKFYFDNNIFCSMRVNFPLFFLGYLQACGKVKSYVLEGSQACVLHDQGYDYLS